MVGRTLPKQQQLCYVSTGTSSWHFNGPMHVAPGALFGKLGGWLRGCGPFGMCYLKTWALTQPRTHTLLG